MQLLYWQQKFNALTKDLWITKSTINDVSAWDIVEIYEYLTQWYKLTVEW